MPTDLRFIACLFDRDDLVEVRLLSGGEQRLVKANVITALETELCEANAAGQNVHVGANPRKRRGGKAEDVALARCLFVDIDGADADTAIKRITQVGVRRAPGEGVTPGDRDKDARWYYQVDKAKKQYLILSQITALPGLLY